MTSLLLLPVVRWHRARRRFVGTFYFVARFQSGGLSPSRGREASCTPYRYHTRSERPRSQRDWLVKISQSSIDDLPCHGNGAPRSQKLVQRHRAEHDISEWIVGQPEVIIGR